MQAPVQFYTNAESIFPYLTSHYIWLRTAILTKDGKSFITAPIYFTPLSKSQHQILKLNSRTSFSRIKLYQLRQIEKQGLKCWQKQLAQRCLTVTAPLVKYYQLAKSRFNIEFFLYVYSFWLVLLCAHRI